MKGLVLAITLCTVVLASPAFRPQEAEVHVDVPTAPETLVSLGDRLERSYTEYVKMPATTAEAKSMGWAPTKGYEGKCEAGMGEPWSPDNGAVPSEHSPLWLYFTPEAAGGQASGSAMLYYDHMYKQKQNLIDLGYIVKSTMVPSAPYQVSVGFRDNSTACATESQTPSTLLLGDRLVVNPSGIAHALPVTVADAESQGWVKGSCFAGMGTHYFYDLVGKGKMTWEGANLLPIVPMYDLESANPTNSINAFLYASTVVQQSVLPPNTNQWEPVPLPNFAMCKNTCSSDCTFHDTSIWSTGHVYMNDHSKVTCKGGCTIGCCS